ncbi:MAG TPA: Stp1/IreP family PP2C-type Ser/Thr phosphatase [Solirubrobacter sp.]|nr:Stp1/IreP family PP2C-type Ser/Thr phosphatase [Solirubrobacter sp.]
MLRIAEHWHGSDLGLQRQGNEDNYFVRAPLFVVADGMGGAQAGEVASEMAVESFSAGIPDGASPAEGLRKIIEDANRRIHERSRSEHLRAGMGTTVTAAHVGEDSVTVAHVGDSRCYLVRDGKLIRLTKDHSLVGELVDRGKLTEEQAEKHPQRSVITRALGPEPNVQVDVVEYPAKAGDLFMVCSDGLTSMVREPKLEPLLAANDRPLAEIGRELIAAANAAGGRDNITVILFTLEEVDAPAGHASSSAAEPARDVSEEDTNEYETFTGEAVTEPRQGVSRPQGHTRHGDEAHARATGTATDEAEAAYRASGTVALSAVRPRAQPIEEGQAHAPPREPPRRRRRRIVTPGRVLALGCVIGLLAAFWLATRQVYFVGIDESRGNVVTLYHGLPYDLPLGIRLYSPVRHSGVTFENVPAHRRGTFTDHTLRSKDDAEGLVLALEQGRIQ